MNIDPKEIEIRKQWFDQYIDDQERHSVIKIPQADVIYHCPCCQYQTLDQRGGYEICVICYWEDDGQDEQDVNIVRGGPNAALSLSQARQNFQNFGACDRQYINNVRKPLTEEM